MNASELHVWLESVDARRPLVMGILNVTPDSFSDGGDRLAADDAVRAAEAMVADGADLIDVGGESTRPGSDPVDAATQIARIVPVIERIRSIGAAISVDTTSAEVAEAALDAGATFVNDVSAARADPAILPLVARRGCAIVLMHMQGDPKSMQLSPSYEDVTREVRAFLCARAAAAIDAGVHRSRIVIDVGIGFGKTIEHNLQLLRDHATFAELGYPVLLGTSRKGFIGKLTNTPDPKDRLPGSLATVAWGLANGASIVRVHDVRETVACVRMIEAIIGRRA
jgi:dihydropteroate synthase